MNDDGRRKRLSRIIGWGVALSALLSGCASDITREDLAGSIDRIADVIVDEIRGPSDVTNGEPPDGSQPNRLVKKIDIYGSSAPPAHCTSCYAADSDNTIAENWGTGFRPIVAQIVYDARGADRRSSEGELESLDRTQIGAIATSAEELTGHEGYIITYYVDGTRSSYFFDDIAVNEITVVDGVVSGYRLRDDDPERSYHDLGWWKIELDDGDYIVAEDAVFGYETRPEVLQALGSATYEGWWQSIFVKREFTSPDQTGLYGSMTLNANLPEGEISGEVTDLYVRPSPQEDPDRTDRYLSATNRIVISNGLISDSRFDADWEVQDENSAGAIDDSIRGFSGEMLGAFYGPNGEEIAGVVTGSRNVIGPTGEVFTGEIFARGSFSGVKSVETCLECL